jgi:hypothetical protein
MFGSRVFWNRQVLSEIMHHSVFKDKERGLTKELVKAFGLFYIRLRGSAVEQRILHSRHRPIHILAGSSFQPWVRHLIQSSEIV